MKRICQLIFLLLSSLEGGVWSLRNLSIDVPRAVLAGEAQSALLRCSYDLEGAALYSIRWYRDEYEFYRYVPRELPPTMVFPLPGATVDLTQSDNHQVFIVNLNRHLSGVYLCEVSADAPLFHTDIRSAPLTIVDVPLYGPLLSVSRLIYARNDVLQANCSTSEAYPAPNITWTLDGHKIAEEITGQIPDLNFMERRVFSKLEIAIQEKDPQRSFYGDIPSTQASLYSHNDNMENLRHAVEPPASGQFTISCVATIFDIYARSSEVINIKEDNPCPASVTRENSLGVTTLCDYWVIVMAICLTIAGRISYYDYLHQTTIKKPNVNVM